MSESRKKRSQTEPVPSGSVAAPELNPPAGNTSPYLSPFAAGGAWRKPLAQLARVGFHPAPGLSKLHVGLANWAGTAVPVFRGTENDRQVAVLHCPDTWYKVASGQWKQTGNSTETERSIRAASSNRFPFPYHSYVTRVASPDGTSLVLPDAYDKRTDPAGLPLRVRAPAGVYPVSGPDGHLVIFQPGGIAFEAFGAVILSDGTIICSTYQMTGATRAGDGVQNGVRASMIPVHAGLVRKHEIANRRIDHAIPMVLPATLMHTSWQYPAVAFDRGALRESPPYSGPYPMGARFALDPSLNLDHLSLETGVGRAIGAALQTHGAILVDRGGGGCTFVVEQQAEGVGYDWGLQSDLIKLMARLRYVSASAAEFVVDGPVPPEPRLSVLPRAGFEGWRLPRGTAAGTAIADVHVDAGVQSAVIYDPKGRIKIEAGKVRLTRSLADAGSALPFAIRAAALGEGKVMPCVFTIQG